MLSGQNNKGGVYDSTPLIGLTGAQNACLFRGASRWMGGVNALLVRYRDERSGQIIAVVIIFLFAASRANADL